MAPAPMVPPDAPHLSQAELHGLIDRFRVDRARFPLVVVGVRGYYRDTMGARGVQERGIYDDAIFLDTPDAFATFNGNTDPSARWKPGLASLVPGCYFAHRFDHHRPAGRTPYPALCQRADKVSVERDGPTRDAPRTRHTGMFGINIHKGGVNTTSSLGCQTIYPDQWDAFITLATTQGKRHFGAEWRRRVVPYVLLEGPVR